MIDDDIKALVRKADVIKAEIDDLEASLKRRKADYERIFTDELVAFMRENGLVSCELDDGRRIIVEEFFNVKKGDPAFLFPWLDENGMSSIIKTDFTFARGQDLHEAKVWLSRNGIQYKEETDVAWNSLQKAIKEHVQNGGEYPPPEVAFVNVFNKCVVKGV